MLIHDEPGPIEKIELWRFPVSRGNRRMFESLAAPVSQQLERHADAIGSVHSDMAVTKVHDINGDFARTIPGAVNEISGQLGSLSAVDPGRMYGSMLAALGEADALASDMSPGSIPPVGGLGGASEFGVVQWAEAGSGGGTRAPSSPGGGGAPAPAPGEPDINEPPPAEAPPSEAPPSEAPPSEPEPPPPAPIGEPSPPPPEPEERLI